MITQLSILKTIHEIIYLKWVKTISVKLSKKKKKYGLRSCSDLGSATKRQSGSDCEPVSAEPEPRGGYQMAESSIKSELRGTQLWANPRVTQASAEGAAQKPT